MKGIFVSQLSSHRFVHSYNWNCQQQLVWDVIFLAVDLSLFWVNG
jgi:hypothetical protein